MRTLSLNAYNFPAGVFVYVCVSLTCLTAGCGVVAGGMSIAIARILEAICRRVHRDIARTNV